MPLSDYDPIFDAAGKEWNVDPNLLRAIGKQESGGNPNAVSGAGARGLMQLMPDTAKGMGVTDPSDMTQHIYAAAKYVSQGLDAEKSPAGALLYYHGGPGWRDNYGPESAAYVPGVAKNYAAITGAKAQAPAAKADAGPSDDDFLKQTGAAVGGKPAAPVPAPANSNEPSDADFLAATGAVADKPVAAQPPVAPDPAAMPTNAPAGVGAAPMDAGVTPGQAGAVIGSAGNVLGAAAQGARSGFGDGPLGLGAPAVNALQQYGVYPPAAGGGTFMQNANQAVIGPLAAGVDLARRGMGAVGGAIGGAVGQGIRELGPSIPNPTNGWVGTAGQAAADIPGVLQGIAGSPGELPAGMAPNNLTAAGVGRVEAADISGNRLASPQAAASLKSALQTDRAPVPQSVGAAASASNETPMGVREQAASRATAENYSIANPKPAPGDATVYVPGSNPTAAEVARDPTVSQQYKVAEQSPGNQGPYLAKQTENNDARVAYYDGMAGTPTIVNRMVEARADQATQDLNTAFANKKPVDVQPVADAVQSILTNPRDAQNSQVQKYIAPLADRLMGHNGGPPLTDAEALYGLREDVSRMMSKPSLASDPSLAHVQGQLADIKTAMDGVIESGAPGYQKYLENYANASKPIDTMNLLQEAAPKLVNGAERTMTFGRYDRFMKDLVSDRQARGLNAAKSIDDDTMDKLMNIHKDLARKENLTLGDARGSPTSMMQRAVAAGATMGAHGVANYVAPVVGSIGLQMGKNALQQRALNKTNSRLLTSPPPPAD